MAHYDEWESIELLRRYCPGLDTRIPGTIFAYLPDDPTVCWPWPSNRDASGYGLILDPDPESLRQWWLVHRYICNCLKGVVDTGNVVHQRCENAACWNPFHLEELA